MHTKNSRPVSVFGPVILVIGLVVGAAPAHAGFQWLSPGSQEAPAPRPAPVEAYPPAQIIEGARPTALQPMAPARQMQETITRQTPPVQDKIVRGFADNVPLSVALRQVLPQEIGFSVAQDVSLGTMVSWKGGAPWREVMQNMLMPVGLAMREQDQVVQVVKATETDRAPFASQPSMAPSTAASVAQIEDAGKPTALLPPASQLPVKSIPDRNAPGGMASGYLAPPPSSMPPLPVSMPSPYVMSNTVDAWTANKGETLQKVLEAWCRRAHVELSWQAEYDFPLQASASLTGSFEEAVRSLLMGFQDAQPQPIAFLHNNQAAGQTVLVVQTRGNNYNE